MKKLKQTPYTEITADNRFFYWKERLPHTIKVLEIELWRRYKLVQLIGLHSRERKKYVGKFRVFPEITDGEMKTFWTQFIQTFEVGVGRKKRFKEVLDDVNGRLPREIIKHGLEKRNDIMAIALTASAFYGPRKENSMRTDYDIHFLLDNPTETGFEFLPSKNNGSFEAPPFHLVGTGYRDEDRGKYPIHWLLWPHIPLHIFCEAQKLEVIIDTLIQNTLQRKEEILQTIFNLDEIIADHRKEIIIG